MFPTRCCWSGNAGGDEAHVAAAHHTAAEVFLTCDAAQAELARAAGLTQVHLIK